MPPPIASVPVQYVNVDDFDFALPDGLIARHPPAERRDARRLSLLVNLVDADLVEDAVAWTETERSSEALDRASAESLAIVTDQEQMLEQAVRHLGGVQNQISKTVEKI